MFLNLAQIYQGQPGPPGPQGQVGQPNGLHAVQQLPATQLSRWLEEIWFTSLPAVQAITAGGGFAQGSQFGQDVENIRRALGHPQPTPQAQHGIEPSGLDPSTPGPPAPFTLAPGPLNLPSLGPLLWQHLIYAYLIESTGAFDIMAEVARRLVAGESLGILQQDSIVWLRNTEELFFRDPPLFGVTGVVSDLRPSQPTNRRNAYWRFFGMDLPHQVPPGWPGSRPADTWKQHAGQGINLDFQEKLVELLRQVWVGITNRSNSTGANPTDEAYVSLLCTAIRDMLHNRRQNGLLAREEFVYVSFMSWFHLTLLDNGAAGIQDSPIVRDLQSQGNAPEQRLNNLAQKVGMKPAARSRELFQLSEIMSILLRSIELGAYDTPAQAKVLFDGSVPAVERDMRNIVNLWQSATGQRIKDHRAVPTTSTQTQPMRIPTPTGATPQPSPNGTRAGV